MDPSTIFGLALAVIVYGLAALLVAIPVGLAVWAIVRIIRARGRNA